MHCSSAAIVKEILNSRIADANTTMTLKRLNRMNAGVTKQRPLKVLQFGDGNFLRAFADWIIDVLNERTDFNGDIVIVAPLRKGRPPIQDDQDGLYHVVLNGIVNGQIVSDTRLISAVSGYIDPYQQFGEFLKAAEHPSLRFVISNTTEAGIVFTPTHTDPNVIADTFPGKVTQLLFQRYCCFNGDPQQGLIFIPCELIENNADQLKTAVSQYAELWNLPDDFLNWVYLSCTFCNSLVDRIVAGFPKEDGDRIKRVTGYDDARVVAAEAYYLWIIEGDNNVQQYLPVSAAGLSVKFVSDLTPYRTRKVRILNGAHTVMTPVAYMRGIKTVREAVHDPWMRTFLERAVLEEIIPTLSLPKEDLMSFSEQVFERFENPSLQHELVSIALNAVSKFKTRVLPSVIEYHAITGRLPENLLHAFAGLIIFYRGDWQGNKLPVNDAPEVMAFFQKVWSGDASETAFNVLSNTSLWGRDLNEINGLTRSLQRAIDAYPLQVKL